ncbi:MAG: hypothetical protein KTR31_23765 [Myxococcales bacterium]|nr:hypothetical protein [Myxococcales bacterium]
MSRQASVVAAAALFVTGLACTGVDLSDPQAVLDQLGAGASSEAPEDVVADAGTPDEGAEGAEAPAEAEDPVDVEAPTEAPTAVAPASLDPDGLAARLQFAPLGGEAVLDRPSTARIIHRDAWDSAKIWGQYASTLEGIGYVREPTRIPPFEGLFRYKNVIIDLRVSSRGPTVTVEVYRRLSK